MEKEYKYITLTELKKRGWTDSIIKKMEIVHDKEKPNPYYSSGSPMKLFSFDKVLELEKSSEFETLHRKSLERKKVAKKAVSTKLNNTMKIANSFRVELLEYDKEDLFEMAVDHYNEYHFPYKHIPTWKCLDEDTLLRITANMVRHTMCDYDTILHQNKGGVGIQQLHDIMQDVVEEVVRKKYKE